MLQPLTPTYKFLAEAKKNTEEQMLTEKQIFHASSLSTMPAIKTRQETICTNFEPDFDLDFARRLLGHKAGRSLPTGSANRLARIEKQIKGIVHPKIIFCFHNLKKDGYNIDQRGNKGVTLDNGTHFTSAKLAYSLRNACSIVAFIATVGRELDLEIDRLMKEGDYADAYVADALGSGAIEHLAENFHHRISNEIKASNLTAGLRFSPGYCDWDVTEQPTVFSLLDAWKIGVSLGDTFLMTPRKSISGIFGLYATGKSPEIRSKNPCLRCAKKNCIARRTDTEKTVQ